MALCGYNDSVSIADNVNRIRERIAAAAARAGRSADEITLVAVSKTFPAECIRAAYAAGVRHFGENRVQEWEKKAAALADLRDATWHLVGHLQSNKARRAVELFHTIDSVDSLALAQRLDRIAAENLTAEDAEGAESRSPQRLPILIEVRLAPEESKHGVELAELPALVEAVMALPHLDLRGLMCIPPWCENPEDARPYFRQLRELRARLTGDSDRADAIRHAAAHRATEESPGAGRKESSGLGEGQPIELATSSRQRAPERARAGCELQVLSMGMSHDFEVAIEEGATHIRLGTAIFGSR